MTPRLHPRANAHSYSHAHSHAPLPSHDTTPQTSLPFHGSCSSGCRARYLILCLPHSLLPTLPASLAPAARKGAELSYATCYHRLEQYKARRAREAIAEQAQALSLMSDQLHILAMAESDLAQLIPPEPAHTTSKPVYGSGPEHSDMIVFKAVTDLGMAHLFDGDEPEVQRSGSAAADLKRPVPKSVIQDLTPVKARDAFDLFTADGRVAEGNMAEKARSCLSGVTDPGKPLAGSHSLRECVSLRVSSGCCLRGGTAATTCARGYPCLTHQLTQPGCEPAVAGEIAYGPLPPPRQPTRRLPSRRRESVARSPNRRLTLSRTRRGSTTALQSTRTSRFKAGRRTPRKNTRR